MAPETKKVYFALIEDPAELGKKLVEKVDKYRRYVREKGLFQIWLTSYQLWYSQDEEGFTAHYIGKKGAKNKKAVLKFNHYRSIVKNWRTLAQAQRSAMQPVAKFTGADADKQVKRAKLALDHYGFHAKLDELEDEAIDLSSFLGAAHFEQCWYDQGGKMVMPGDTAGLLPEEAPPEGMPPPPSQQTVEPSGKPSPPPPAPDVMTGTVEGEVYDPTCFIVDPIRPNHRAPWCITMKWMNKFDVATRYGRSDEEKARIIELTRPKAEDLLCLDLIATGKEGDWDSDDIPVYTFWHEKTPSHPMVSKRVFLNGDLVFDREQLKLDHVPIRRIAPGNIRFSPFGYSEAWDLIAPQRALDVLKSVSFTNAKTFGAANFTATKGTGVKATAIADGLNLIEHNQGFEPPKPLEVPTTPPEVYSSMEKMTGEMGTLIGVNKVARGEPEASLESGSALALVQAQAVQYSSDYQSAITEFSKGRAFDTILLVQHYLTKEAEFESMGDSLSSVQMFDGDGVKDIVRVDVKPVNPMMKTIGGKFQIAQFLAERFPDKVTPAQVMEMFVSGSTDCLTEDTETEQLNIKRENSLLEQGHGPPPKVPKTDPMTGQPVMGPDGQPVMVRAAGEEGKLYVRALLTDNPFEHIKGHKRLLDSPQVREDANLVTAVLDHIQEHEELAMWLTSQRPGLLELLGYPPIQAAIPQMGAPAPGGGAPLSQGPGGAEGGGAVRPPTGPAGGGPAELAAPPRPGTPGKMPQFPQNPATGERFQPPPPGGG